MNCINCPYNNAGSGTDRPIMAFPYGNNWTLMFPLTSVSVNVTNGVVSKSDRTFPIFDVKVVLVRGKHEYDYPPTISTNVITIRDDGQLPIGTYDIVISYRGTDGQQYRLKQRTMLRIFDAAKDGGEYENDEVDIITHYPTIRGRISAIDVTDSEVFITEGRGYSGDNTPNDGNADISAEYGSNQMTINEDEVIITI